MWPHVAGYYRACIQHLLRASPIQQHCKHIIPLPQGRMRSKQEHKTQRKLQAACNERLCVTHSPLTACLPANGPGCQQEQGPCPLGADPAAGAVAVAGVHSWCCWWGPAAHGQSHSRFPDACVVSSTWAHLHRYCCGHKGCTDQEPVPPAAPVVAHASCASASAAVMPVRPAAEPVSAYRTRIHGAMLTRTQTGNVAGRRQRPCSTVQPSKSTLRALPPPYWLNKTARQLLLQPLYSAAVEQSQQPT
jgi:hypothetical protein